MFAGVLAEIAVLILTLYVSLDNSRQREVRMIY